MIWRRERIERARAMPLGQVRVDSWAFARIAVADPRQLLSPDLFHQAPREDPSVIQGASRA
jgi:hypothetical protein